MAPPGKAPVSLSPVGLSVLCALGALLGTPPSAHAVAGHPQAISARGAPAVSQADDSAALALVRKARALRATALVGGATPAYKARAEGHVYFYLDREDGGAPVPMRVDQVALDLFQDESGRTGQVMRGRRRKQFLPVRDFEYYIDRLTAVQNGFGDRIAVGEGMDVRDVPHPLSALGEAHYRYRLAGLVQLRVPSLPSPVRVREVEVRPRDPARPAFVGSVFLESATGGLVGMAFSFTPASYVDPRVDRVAIRLDHALWRERYWLPYRQSVEVRREMPRLDLPVGAVIRAKLEVTEYDFEWDAGDARPDDGFSPGSPVARTPYGAAPAGQFKVGLTERMADEGLVPVSPAAVEAEARRLARHAARERLLGGLPRLRLHADRFSSVFRANRVEGAHMGLGASFAASSSVDARALAGYGTGNRKVSASVRARWRLPERPATLSAEAYAGRLRDIGPRPGASGTVNTLATLALNEDYTDPYFASGGRLTVERRAPEGHRAWAAGFAERHRRAEQVWFGGDGVEGVEGVAGASDGGGRFRPVRPVAEGVHAGLEAGYGRVWGGLGRWGGGATFTASASWWEGVAVGSVLLRLEGRTAAQDLSRKASISLEAGRSWGALPPQLLFYLGGRGTLPGHPFREYGGRAFVLATGEASLVVAPGWLALRALVGAGAAGATPDALRESWGLRRTEGLLGYVGAGVATLHDTVRLDGAWGFPGGAFELSLSASPWLRPYL